MGIWQERLNRGDAPTTSETILALVCSPELYALADLIPARSPVGRPRAHPPWSVIMFGALARHYRSGARTQNELATPLMWAYLQHAAARARRLGLPATGLDGPPTWSAWMHARDYYLATDQGLAAVAAVHLDSAVDLAHQLGLASRAGGGSWSHPAKTRTVYGDGTLVTPMYRPPKAIRQLDPDGTVRVSYPDPETGELRTTPPRRYDPDALEHHGKAGPVHATNYVAWHLRGPSYYERVILTIGVVQAPGREADTAVALLGDIHRVLKDDVQAAVYDGAMRGRHLDVIMRRYGYVPIAKVHTDTPTVLTPTSVRLPTGRAASSYPLGTWEHDVAGRACRHLVAAVNGAACEIGLADTGDPVLRGLLARRQVKRPRRGTGEYHFSVGYEVPCPAEPFLVWISPHNKPPTEPARAEHVRIISAADPDGTRIVGIRSDAEGHHSMFKRTLLIDRAMTLGARRGLLDQHAYALMHNALVLHRQRADASRDNRWAGTSKPRRRRGR